MKLIFKQRLFSWLDSYDIYRDTGSRVFTVEGKISWGHKLHILNDSGQHIATVKETVLTFLPRFELYENNRYLGCIQQKFSLFRPQFELDFNGWQVTGDVFGWDYSILDARGQHRASVCKELFHFTDTYVIETVREEDALYALMVTLAIDAGKCSGNQS